MQRVILVILFTFWAFMTYRLWQVEYAGQSLGAAVDIQVVWEKILNAQDEAKLQIVDERSNHLLGALDWTPTVQRETEDDERANIVGMVENVREYTLDISRGRLYAVRSQEDLLFDFNLNLSPFPSQEWTAIQIKLERSFNDVRYKFSADAQSTNDFVTFRINLEGGEQKVDVPLEDVSKPEKLVGAGLKLAGVPALAASGASLMVKNFLNSKELNNRPLNFKLDLPRQAHIDLLPGVRSRIKVYRIDVPIVEDMLVKIYVNTLGEILRVEIPDVLSDTISKTSKLDLPKSIVLRNQNFYGRLRRER